MEIADRAAPLQRLRDACLLAFAAGGTFFGTVAVREGEGPMCRFTEAQRELALVGETFDLRLVEHGVVRASHPRQLWTAQAARAKGACYERAVIARFVRSFFGLGTALALGALAALVGPACANSSRDTFDPSAAADGGGVGRPFSTDGGMPDLTGQGEVFGHSENTLYRVDTVSRAVTEVGVFDGCTYVADIALDQDSNIYASTGSELFYVETNTAHCTRIAGGTFPNSLSFVPAGAIDPDHETLVGFQGGDYVKIDPATGVVTKVGELGGGLESSGDVVSAKGGKTYVSVKGKAADGTQCADCLVEIDPATGSLTKNWGPIGRVDVFGLAFWAGDIYAFTNAGELLLVSLATGTLVATPIPVTNAPMKFWGAGSTTSAPTGPVR